MHALHVHAKSFSIKKSNHQIAVELCLSLLSYDTMVRTFQIPLVLSEIFDIIKSDVALKALKRKNRFEPRQSQCVVSLSKTH